MTGAPLLSIPDDPVPEGGRAFWYEGVGGARLRAAIFDQPSARGTIILSPGRTESLDKYWEAVRRLRAMGFAVVSHDWRGQGLSEPRQADPLLGHVERADDYASDYRRLLDAVEAQAPRPWIALAHSMGGMAVLLALAAGEARLAGAAFSAPLLGLDEVTRRPRLLSALIGLLRLTGRIKTPLPLRDAVPKLENFEGNPLTHDRARYERWVRLTAAYPAMTVGRPSFGWLGAVMAAFAALKTLRAEGLPPLLFFGAAEDRVVRTAAVKAMAAQIPGARYVEIAGARHEIMFEADEIAAPFWAELAGFLNAVSARRV